MKRLLLHLSLPLLLLAVDARAVLSDVTHQTMAEVVKIARLIAVVQPYLDETKLMEFGLGIYRASKRYDIDPDVLISIAQQETNFRENLPEGKAGEIGIVQIRKAWLKHPQFIREFGKASIKELRKPSKAFMMAAWILRDLKARGSASRTLPYWSYYNSVRFENRFKYFLLVNKNIAALRKYAIAQGETVAPLPAVKAEPRTIAKADEPLPVKKAATSLGSAGRWISDAVDKLQKTKPKPAAVVPAADGAPQASNRPGYRNAVDVAIDDSRLDRAIQD